MKSINVPCLHLKEHLSQTAFLKLSQMTTEDEIIEDLVEQNDLLENYFRNTIIPQLFVDADLVLRKFTPPAMKQFQLSLSDLGKPVDNVKDNFRFAGIMENIQYVIDNNEILEKEVQTNDLKWFQMMAR